MVPDRAAWHLYPGSLLGRLFGGHAGVRALFMTPTGDLWVAAGMDVLLYRQERWRRAVPSPQQGVYEFSSFAWYRNTLWAGGSLGLHVYDHGYWRQVENLPFALAICLTVDSVGHLWVGTMQGLWRTGDGQVWNQISLPSQGTTILALCSDTTGSVWVAERGYRPSVRPIYRWRNEAAAWETLPLPAKSRAFNYISTLMVDSTGQLWAGSSINGIFCWTAGAWRHFSATMAADRSKPGLPGRDISGLCSDRHGRVWAATSGGIGVYSEEVWRIVLVAPQQGLNSDSLQIWVPLGISIPHLDTEGRLWIGTIDGQVGWIDTTQDAYTVSQAAIKGYYQPPAITVT